MHIFDKARANPGKRYEESDCTTEDERDAVEEGGGSFYYCDVCDWIAQPNRPCSCPASDNGMGLGNYVIVEQGYKRIAAQIIGSGYSTELGSFVTLDVDGERKRLKERDMRIVCSADFKSLTEEDLT